MPPQLLGRDELLVEIADLLGRGHSVLLYGPPHVGKSALVAALQSNHFQSLEVVDPFEHVTSHEAAQIRRAMDLRAQQYLAAARSLDRAYLGAVRRIAWRFTTIRVHPLSNRNTQRVIERVVGEVGRNAPAPGWLRQAASLAGGRPGVALAIAEAAIRAHERKGQWPSAPAAFVAARICQEGFGGV